MKRSDAVLQWLPRIICILAILTLSMFAFDSFAPNLNPIQQLRNFLLHLIPSFILVILLIVAWKWELVGGIIITVFALGLSPSIYLNNYNHNNSIGVSLLIVLTVTFPFIIAGIFFIIIHLRKRKKLRSINV